MPKYLLTKRTPFNNMDGPYPMGAFRDQAFSAAYDEVREHEVLTLEVTSLKDAAKLLGFDGVIRQYLGISYFKRITLSEDSTQSSYFETLSEWVGHVNIGLFYPPKFGDQLYE